MCSMESSKVSLVVAARAVFVPVNNTRAFLRASLSFLVALLTPLTIITVVSIAVHALLTPAF